MILRYAKSKYTLSIDSEICDTKLIMRVCTGRSSVSVSVSVSVRVRVSVSVRVRVRVRVRVSVSVRVSVRVRVSVSVSVSVPGGERSQHHAALASCRGS